MVESLSGCLSHSVMQTGAQIEHIDVARRAECTSSTIPLFTDRAEVKRQSH